MLRCWSLILQVSYTQPLQTFPIVKSLLLVQIIAFLNLLYAHDNPHLRKYCPSRVVFVYIDSVRHPCPYNLKI